MSLEKMMSDYKSEAELRAFAEAQFKTIIELSKKNKSLEDEISELKKIVAVTTPLLPEERPLFDPTLYISEEEMIARMQLQKLNAISQDRELTLEEAKRVEIFSKILNSFRNAPKTIKVETKKLKDEELLVLLEDGSEQK